MSTTRTPNDEWGVPRTRSALESGEDETWKWERHAARAMAQWQEPPLGRSALRQMTRDVTLVWRKKESQGQTTQTPWVIVAESAALRLSGVQGEGLGLYAWKDFDRDDPIGKYSGKVIGEYHAEDLKGRERVVRQYGGSGTPEYLCEIDVEGGRKVRIIDAAAAGPPFLQRANDSRGLTNGRGASCTTPP